MRLKLDESLPVELAELFREAWHDAVTSTIAGTHAPTFAWLP